jgi:hypothetical protein
MRHDALSAPPVHAGSAARCRPFSTLNGESPQRETMCEINRQTASEEGVPLRLGDRRTRVILPCRKMCYASTS